MPARVHIGKEKSACENRLPRFPYSRQSGSGPIHDNKRVDRYQSDGIDSRPPVALYHFAKQRTCDRSSDWTVPLKAKDPADLMKFLEQHGLEAYVDGGWAVDGLLGQQTRAHGNLDKLWHGLWGSMKGWHLHRKRIL